MSDQRTVHFNWVEAVVFRRDSGIVNISETVALLFSGLVFGPMILAEIMHN